MIPSHWQSIFYGLPFILSVSDDWFPINFPLKTTWSPHNPPTPPSPPLQMLNCVLVPQTNFNSTSFDRKELTQIISILLCLHSKGEDLLIIRVSRDRRHREDKGFLEREGLIKESSWRQKFELLFSFSTVTQSGYEWRSNIRFMVKFPRYWKRKWMRPLRNVDIL